jgi:hypothetical protein
MTKKLTIEEKTRREAQSKRYDDRHDHMFSVQAETALTAVRTVLPDVATYEGGIGSGEGTATYIDIDNLPKWLADIVEKLDDGNVYNSGEPHRVAEAAAEKAAEAAYDEAFTKTYAEVYRETFEEKFTLAIAEREGRVVTDYDYENIVDGDATKTVHIFATEAEADAFRDALNEKRQAKREAHKAALRAEDSANRHIAEIYDLTGAKRPITDD